MEGDKVKVLVKVNVDGDCSIFVPEKEGMNKLSLETGSHLLWLHDFVIVQDEKVM